MIPNQLTTLFVLLTLVSTACVHREYQEDSRLNSASIFKNSSSKPIEKEAEPLGNVDRQREVSWKVYGKLLLRKPLLSDLEKTYLNELDPFPQRDSRDEAVTVLWIMHQGLASHDENLSEVKRVPSGVGVRQNQSDQQLKERFDLETKSRDYGIDFADAIESNPLLQDPRVLRLILATISVSELKDQFREEIKTAIAAKSQEWDNLVQSLENRTVELPGDKESQSLDEQELGKPLAISTPTMKSDEETLTFAQQQADRKEYKHAISLLEKIKEDSALFVISQEKVRQYSNIAVLELRRQAARSFQNAMPVSDQKAKIVYLEEAQRYLKNAIADFPKADHISTVEQNLNIIEREISRSK